MRRRAQSYRTLDGLNGQRDNTVPWYWRLVALGSSLLILGGYLILPITFDNDPLLRVSSTALGIFAVALVVAGFSTTLLISLAVRNLRFRADSVFLPAVVSCAIGTLTVFYNFLISTRFVWNLPAIITVIVAAISLVVYAGALYWTYAQIDPSPSAVPPPLPLVQEPPREVERETMSWQPPEYYQNYIRNMWPTASNEAITPPAIDSSAITEEDMQRQQMLMLLLRQGELVNPRSSSNTFRIDWNGPEHDADSPVNGYYAPGQSSTGQSSAYSQTSYGPPRTLTRQFTGDLIPWDGVWRGVSQQPVARDAAGDRESRRREIEMGH